jgi:putative endonuclease
MKDYVVYLIECSDGTFYCGITNNIERRVKEHNKGTASKYTRGRRPVKLLGRSAKMSKSRALKSEYKVKQLLRSEKLAKVREM